MLLPRGDGRTNELADGAELGAEGCPLRWLFGPVPGVQASETDVDAAAPPITPAMAVASADAESDRGTSDKRELLLTPEPKPRRSAAACALCVRLAGLICARGTTAGERGVPIPSLRGISRGGSFLPLPTGVEALSGLSGNDAATGESALGRVGGSWIGASVLRERLERCPVLRGPGGGAEPAERGWDSAGDFGEIRPPSMLCRVSSTPSVEPIVGERLSISPPPPPPLPPPLPLPLKSPPPLRPLPPPPPPRPLPPKIPWPSMEAVAVRNAPPPDEGRVDARGSGDGVPLPLDAA